MNAVLLRPALETDILALQRVESSAAEVFPPGTVPTADTHAMSAQELVRAQADGLLWVADLPGQGAIGFIAMERIGECLHITEMDVLPTHGQKGVGTQLLHKAFSIAKARGCRWLTLTTFEHLAWNAPFYRKHGFSQVSDEGMFPHLREKLGLERQLGLARRIAMVKDISTGPVSPGASNLQETP